MQPHEGEEGNLAPKAWEYRDWPLYNVCMGCGAAYGSLCAVGCSRPGRQDVRVVLGRPVIFETRSVAERDAVLKALDETSSTEERIEGLRKLGLQNRDIGRACGTDEETVRLWSNGRQMSGREHRLLDRLRYATLLVLREVPRLDLALSWLTDVHEDLQARPVDAFAERSRDVMSLSKRHAVALYDAAHRLAGEG